MSSPLDSVLLPMNLVTPEISVTQPSTPGATHVDPKTIELAPSATSLTKRAIDLCGAIVGLTLLGPVMIVVAILIRRDSTGPIFFRQRRLGLQGNTFWVLKFRTMVTDAELRLREIESLNESQGGVLFKIKDDPRVTRIGRILRKTSLDELPQLINVLRGEMSLVGPRPLQLRDSDLLSTLRPEDFARRLSVMPGASGPWQVGGRSELSVEGMLELDLDYVDNWSLRRDFKIILQTILVIFTGKGAC
jgi:lipopolysaccharide/colanic/teichoic acid biosynthesis glycosyltransferase